MPAFADTLTEEQIQDVAAYVSSAAGLRRSRASLGCRLLERCPSGRRSATGNRVRAERCVAGSNPALSVVMARRRVVVLGAGSSGEHFVGALRRLDADVEITIVERELAGGECSYYACLPTKTLLRPTEVLAAARLAPGAAEAVTGRDRRRARPLVARPGHRRPRRLVACRLARGAARGARARRGARRRGPASSRSASASSSTTSSSSRPARRRRCRRSTGLDDVDYWTNRDAVWASRGPGEPRRPRRRPVGVELAQFFRRMGSEVTLVEHNEHLLARLDPDAGTLLAERFEEDGIRVLVGTRRERRGVDGGDRVQLASGRRSRPSAPRRDGTPAERRRPRARAARRRGHERGVTVDDRLRAADGVWAIGDAAGVGLLTHLGKYQARVAAANIAGRDVAPTTARFRPRCSRTRRWRASGAWRATAS